MPGYADVDVVITRFQPRCMIWSRHDGRKKSLLIEFEDAGSSSSSIHRDLQVPINRMLLIDVIRRSSEVGSLCS